MWQDFAIGGFAASTIVVALASWLAKVWASKILQNDRTKYQTQMNSLLQDMRTRDSKELYVHKLQFDKEFEIYSTLWRKVRRLALACNEFRELQKDTGELIDQQIAELVETINKVQAVVYDSRPFYAPGVYERCLDILKHGWQVLRTVKRASNQTPVKHERIEASLDEIQKGIEPLVLAIRERIWSTGNTGWDRREAESVGRAN